MAKATRQKPSVSPKGIAIWPKLNTPDTKFKAEGTYGVKLKLSTEVAQPLVDTIDAGILEQLAAAKKAFTEDEKNKGKKFENSKLAKLVDKPYTIGEGDDDGFVFFNFKMTASGVNKETKKPWTRSPALFDAKGAPLSSEVRVGGGSTIKVAYTLNPFSTPLGTGMSLRLESVQVLDLKEFSRDAKSYGFESEDGFDGTGESAALAAVTEEEAADAGGDGNKGADF